MESKEEEIYTYDVKDGQFGFQVEIPQLLGKVGDYIYITPAGVDYDKINEVKIIEIDDLWVTCYGTIKDPV